MSDKAKRSRRFRPRFTLRTLLVLITLFMLWGGYHTNRSWKERAAQRILLERGASLNSATLQRNAGVSGRIAFCYQRLVQFVWREPYIAQVHLYAPLDGEAVEALIELPHLQAAWLTPGQMTDEEKSRHSSENRFSPRHRTPPGAIPRILAAHPNLKHLACGMYRMSDEDCAAIGNHAGLRSVSINLSNCSENGLARIVQAPKLRNIAFGSTNLTGRGLVSSPGSPTLELVECYGAPVGPEFAAFIAKCPKVEIFQAMGETVNDDFAAELTAHPTLRQLYLDGPITPAGFENMIAKMPTLEWVTVSRFSVSRQRVEDLNIQRPALRIDRR